MTIQSLSFLPLVLIAAVLATPTEVDAQRKKRRRAPAPSLTKQGQVLQQGYARQLEALRGSLLRRLPKVSPQRQAACDRAKQAETAAKADLKAAQQALGKVATAQALVKHAKGKWIGGADKGIAKAQAALRKATDSKARDAARKELAKWQKNREEGVKALRERQAALDAATRDRPRLQKAVVAAEKALARAQTRARTAVRGLGLDNFLASDALDADFAKFVVLFEATPRGLAAFAQQGDAHRQRVERLLANRDLMLQMVVADGAKDGRYGEAMAIYEKILAAGETEATKTDRDEARSRTLQRLALAVALEHAVPRPLRNPKGATDAPATVDPVARYQHFASAFTRGELDPAFDQLSVWDYRMVVDGEEPDEILAWGREMLRSYRPDHVYSSDPRWRYVALVRTDVRYGSQDNRYDRPELQFFQNILMNGGVCGRRAFIGRFILRAFGVPTTARPQRGHAALAHWTPKGWVVCLGAGWGSGWTKTRYNKDLDFLATTQARTDLKSYLQVKRAQWAGDVVGEKRVFGFLSGKPGFWYGVSLYRQRSLVEASKAETLAPVGQELGEANESNVRYAIEAAQVTDADRKIVVDPRGVITIPAVACSSPKKSSGKVIFMPSNLGGKQLHYSRTGRSKDLQYTFDAPAAGRYALTARVATPSWQQRLAISVNDNPDPVDLALPHTVGLWGATEAVEIQLQKGRNVLTFRHRSEGHAKGFSIKDFTLTPVR